MVHHPGKFAPNYPDPGVTDRQAKFYSANLISALCHLEEKQVCHRDVKGENMVVGIDGYLKIIDFGFAKIIKEKEKATTLCGTWCYFAPELLVRHHALPRRDHVDGLAAAPARL